MYGSLILVDDKGGFYLGDHAGVIDKSTFEAFDPMSRFSTN